MIRHNDIEYSAKQTIFGVKIIVRVAVPDESPGVFKWSRWKRPNHVQYVEALQRIINNET